MTQDEVYMQMAIDLAGMALGQTSPNPAVGAVLVKEGRIVGIGTHLKAGEPHAEIHALQIAGAQASGSTLFVTLEPCAHFGKTPPCADALVAAGVKRVVAALEDPNVLVAGKGFSRLQNAGIEITVGVQKEQAASQNEAYLHFARSGYPFVILKMAATLDGYTATPSGDSFYISTDASREEVHQLRSRVDAVVVGVETILRDNPRLTVRSPSASRNPVRVVFDSYLRIPLQANVVNDSSARTIVVCTDMAPIDKELALQEKGVEIIRLPAQDHRVPLRLAMQMIASKGYIYLLLEGGNRLASSCVAEQLVSRVWIFHAPKLLGGGKNMLSWRSPVRISEAISLKDVEYKQFGDDSLTIGDIMYREED